MGDFEPDETFIGLILDSVHGKTHLYIGRVATNYIINFSVELVSVSAIKHEADEERKVTPNFEEEGDMELTGETPIEKHDQ